jgi:chromate transporter
MTTTMPNAAERPAITFWEALRYWLKLGCISFGGPAGQIAVMHQDLVERRRWISERRFLHALNYCMMLPGPEAQQLATYIGWLMHGVKGGIAAGALFVLPSLVLLIALSWIYVRFGQVPAVAGVLYGIKPAVTAIVLFAAWRIGSRTLKNPWLIAIAVAAFLAVFVLHVPFPYIVLTAGLFGALGGRVIPRAFSMQSAHGAGVKSYGTALIDDTTPTPAHAIFSWRKLVIFVVIGLLLWAGALVLCTLISGWGGTYAQMGWFFTKAALLTFGGAYAVLPYVYQGAVLHYQWLTAIQMIDGLALGETTPGPLIMIVAFVGFIGGWTQPVWGPESLVLAGITGASVATYFTFLPSFLFILIGAPLIEATHGI